MLKTYLITYTLNLIVVFLNILLIFIQLKSSNPNLYLLCIHSIIVGSYATVTYFTLKNTDEEFKK